MTSNRVRRLAALVFLLTALAVGGCGDAPTSKSEPVSPNPPPTAPPQPVPKDAKKME